MNASANVSKPALEGLASGIVRFKGRLDSIHRDVHIVIGRYFQHFDAQQKILQNRFYDSVNRLVSAENELREARYKYRLVRNDDGEWEHIPVDLTPYYNKVMACGRAKDDCEEKLTTCKNIIKHCEYQKNMHKGCFEVIMRGVDSSAAKLDEYINDINHYNGYERDHVTEMPKFSAPDEDMTIESAKPQKVTKLILYDREGNPIADGRIMIVDNNIFGFGRREVMTNDKGEVVTEYVSSNDCSIYLDGDEIYNGNLFQEMEYNKYGDGRFVSSLSENNTSESERVAFEQLGYEQIDVTHKIEVESAGKGARREEGFKWDDTQHLQEIEITAKSDDLKSESKDGWMKMIKQEEDDKL